MNIIKTSINRPSLIIVIISLLLIGGSYAYSLLNYELIPKFEVNVVTIVTVYPGASPSEVESTVTKKIEDAVSTLENIKVLQSQSMENVSVVVIQLTTQADANLSLNDAQRKINAIRSQLPKDAQEPSISKFSLDDLPIVTLGVTSKLSDQDLYTFVDKNIKPELSRIAGVAEINIVGGREREIRVSIDPKKAEGYGMSISQIQQLIAASNMDFPTGKIKDRDNYITVRLSGKFKTVDELRGLVLANVNGSDIVLSDLADVQDTEVEASTLARIDQKSTLLLQVKKQTDANAVLVSKLVHDKIREIEKSYSYSGVKFVTANDTSTFTLDASNAVMFDLFLAIALVAFVMLFFLHSLRNAFIVMVSIPTSLISTFIGLWLLGYTLNLMTLVALSLVVGILVDDAIVVIENIHRHKEMGKNKVRAAYDGAKEIGFTVTAITLVIVVVFLPIALGQGFVTNIIKQFCVTVILATMFSLFMSFTTVPWLYSRFGKLERISQKSLIGRVVHGFESGLNSFTDFVTNILSWCLHHKVSTLVLASVLFFSSIFLVAKGYVGAEFFPGMDKGEFLVQIELPKDASLEKTNFTTQKAEDYLSNLKDVKSLITTVGLTSSGVASSLTSNKSEIRVSLTDKNERSETTKIYAAKLKRELEKILIGAKVKTAPMGMMGAEVAQIELTVTAPDAQTAQKYALELSNILKTIDGTSEVTLSSEDGNPEIMVSMDRSKMARLGLNVASVGMTMRAAFTGNDESKFRMGDDEYDIRVMYNEAERATIEDIYSLKFPNQRGELIPITQFAKIEYGSGPTQLERYNKAPSVKVTSQAVGRTSGEIISQWQEEFSKIEKPDDVKFILSGMSGDQQESMGTLGVSLLAAILLVYMIMVVLYDSFSRPFVVLFSIPLSLIGALWALALTNISLNIFTILGMIMLIGLVAKNAILLVDFANHRKQEGDSTIDALISANRARLRPILMTTIAMVFGMVPIALASGSASEMNNGLAIVIIGGLISSLFLTLVVVPVVYLIFDIVIGKISKGEKVDYDRMMIEDYSA